MRRGREQRHREFLLRRRVPFQSEWFRQLRWQRLHASRHVHEWRLLRGLVRQRICLLDLRRHVQRERRHDECLF